MATIPRRAYAEMFGPTTGDRVRLADTELVIEVERDLTVLGEEVKFGGGKTIRDGMGQSQRVNGPGAGEAVDCVLTNALIVDHWGIVKADIGLRGSRIAAIGKAGNPDVQPGVDIVIGPGTEIMPSPAMISVPGPMTMSTPGCTSGLPALPIALIRPFFSPMSALTMPQWSMISALVMTQSTASSRPGPLTRWLWPMPSRITLPPPNFTSSP